LLLLLLLLLLLPLATRLEIVGVAGDLSLVAPNLVVVDAADPYLEPQVQPVPLPLRR
jgi:hypothetical protein